MKRNALALLFSLMSCPAFAVTERRVSSARHLGLAYTVGIGRYGLVAAETQIYPGETMDLHAGIGVGVGSFIAGGGLRVYTSPGECLLLKYCVNRIFAAVTYSASLATVGEVKEENLPASRYRVSEYQAIQPSVGVASTLFSFLDTRLAIGYRGVLTPARIELLEGERREKFEKAAESYSKLPFVLEVGLGVVL